MRFLHYNTYLFKYLPSNLDHTETRKVDLLFHSFQTSIEGKLQHKVEILLDIHNIPICMLVCTNWFMDPQNYHYYKSVHKLHY